MYRYQIWRRSHVQFIDNFSQLKREEKCRIFGYIESPVLHNKFGSITYTMSIFAIRLHSCIMPNQNESVLEPAFRNPDPINYLVTTFPSLD